MLAFNNERFTPAAEGSSGHDRNDFVQCAEVVRAHAETTRVLASQMRAVVELTQSAAQSIAVRVAQSHEDVLAIVGSLKEALAQSQPPGDGDSPDGATLEAWIERGTREVAEDRHRLGQVAVRVHETKSMLAEWNDFARSAKTLAQNARREASLAGDHSTAFKRVAEEMRRGAETMKGTASEPENAVRNPFGRPADARATQRLDGLADLRSQDIARKRLELVLEALDVLDVHMTNLRAHAEADDWIDVLAHAKELEALALFGQSARGARGDLARPSSKGTAGRR